MSFSAAQVEAVRHAFYLANFDGELRTLPVESDHERIFILPSEEMHTTGDHRSLEIVLGMLLDRKVLVTADIGGPAVAFQ